MTRSRTALLADPQPTFRAGLAAALRRADIDVVAEAAESREAVEAASRANPGVCVIDEDLPGGAIAAIKRITERAPEALVVVIASSPGDESLVAAVRAGAVGYLPRSTTARGLARAVDAVLDGSAAIPRAGVGALVREVQLRGRRRRAIGTSSVSLTEREAMIVELLSEGLDTRAIAEELGLSPITVRRHVSAVAGKAGARGRDSLVRRLQT